MLLITIYFYSMKKQQHGHSTNYLLLCFVEERESYRFDLRVNTL